MTVVREQSDRVVQFRTAAGVVGGGSAVITTLSLAGAPWWAIAVAGGVSLAAATTIALTQICMPQESEHKRDLWLAVIRHRERRSSGGPPQPGGSRAERRRR